LKVIESGVHGILIFITEKIVVEMLNLLKITSANYYPSRPTKKKKKKEAAILNHSIKGIS
jgi:hypothetical protein